MNNSDKLEKRLDQLGRDLGTQPSLVASVASQLEPHAVTQRRATRSGPRIREIASIGAAACVVLAATMLATQPSTLYAKAIKALSRVQTVHVSGWSTRVDRGWPLENPEKDSGERRDVEMWFWKSVDGTARSYERCGAVTKSRTGDSMHEHQEDVDLLYIVEGSNNDQVEEFASIASYLREMKDAKQEDLGTRTEQGKHLRGVRVTRHNRIDEYWFDSTSDLPVVFSRKLVESEDPAFELRFSYDETVPESVAAYTPPKATSVRYGGRHENVELAWKQHVETVWQRKTPFDGSANVVERDGQVTFDHQWPLKTPDGKYWVLPIDLDQYMPMNIDHFIRLRVAQADSDRDVSTWRVSKELLDMEFPRCDLIYEDGTPWQEWVQHFLNENGLEYTDVW